ncbi:uncharacterized protein LOC130267178 [Hyla sarda]|uniref:uncharacterized protein LOC130267178 n=1 Tax=Hyla sarda TaxID=327740 RepID=UPI0024C219BE|nr:uncharacterized protein LOC130267178 [Hyla sarda]
MNYENPPPYSGVNPPQPYPPFGQPQGGPALYPGYPPNPAGYQPGYQGYPQYEWQGGQPPAPVYMEVPKNTGFPRLRCGQDMTSLIRFPCDCSAPPLLIGTRRTQTLFRLEEVREPHKTTCSSSPVLHYSSPACSLYPASTA